MAETKTKASPLRNFVQSIKKMRGAAPGAAGAPPQPPVLHTSSKGDGPAKAPAPPASKSAGPSANAATEGLPKKAKVIHLGGLRYQYDFGRPITHDQAAQVLFTDGKVPSEARLVQGPGNNSWTLETSDLDDQQAMLKKMRTRIETVSPGKPTAPPVPGQWNPPPPHEITQDFDVGPNTPDPRPKRADLHNNFGFKITKHYPLDQGQAPNDLVKNRFFGMGHGYELTFEQPITKAQVMDKLFTKDLGTGAVQLKPGSPEPATAWQVHVIGVDAIGSIKRPFGRAFSDANVYAKESIAPSVPAGIRKHIENKTVPKDAVKHPGNVHVWEQEGYLVRVISHGEGKDAHYSFETTKISHADEAGKITIRYFMLEEGLPPRKAWQEFIKHWEWIHMQMIAGLAAALSSGRLPGRAPTIKTTITPRRTPIKGPPAAGKTPAVGKSPAATQKPGSDIGAASTTGPKPTRGRPLDDTQPLPGNIRQPKTPPPPQKPDPPPVGGGRGRPLDDTQPAIKIQPTAPSSSPGAPSSPGTPSKPGGPQPKYDTMAPKNLPDSQKISINTPGGPKPMTVGQYRQKVRDAQKWMGEQRFGGKKPDEQLLNKQAADKFGLDKNWNSVNNPYVY